MSDQAFFVAPGASGTVIPRLSNQFNVVVNFAEGEPFMIVYPPSAREIFGEVADMIFVATGGPGFIDEAPELRAFTVTRKGTLEEVASYPILYEEGDGSDIIDAVNNLVARYRFTNELPQADTPLPVFFCSL